MVCRGCDRSGLLEKKKARKNLAALVGKVQTESHVGGNGGKVKKVE